MVVLRFVVMTAAIVSLLAVDQGKLSAVPIAQGNVVKGSIGQKEARRNVSFAGRKRPAVGKDDEGEDSTGQNRYFCILGGA